ncbi:MAG: hypothetical protein ACI35W_04560 [Anaeroplasmataceae bacterium]
MINEKLMKRYMNGNMVLFKRIAKSFVESYENFSKIAFSLPTKELYKEIHSQKGVSLNLGLEDVYIKSTQLCDDYKKGIIKDDEISEYLSLIDIAIEDLKEALE